MAPMLPAPRDQCLSRTWRALVVLSPAVVLVPAFLPGAGVSLATPAPGLFRLVEWLLLATAMASVVAATTAWRAGPRTVEGLLPAAGLIAVVLTTATRIGAQPGLAGDFVCCYLPAAEAVRAGVSPWAAGVQGYLYPPTLAWLLAASTELVLRVLPGPEAPDAFASVSFYLFSCTQLALAAVLYRLLHWAGQVAGLGASVSALVAGGLIIATAPSADTILAQQVNLIVPVTALGALALLRRSDAGAGLCLAIGVVVKVYPVVVAAAWLATGHRRAALWAGAWTAGLVGLIAPWGWWVQFVQRLAAGAEGGYPQNNDASLGSIVANTARVLGLADPADPPAWIGVVAVVAVAAAAMWAVHRMYGRQAASPRDLDRVVLDHTSDLLALALLMSPIVWRHHYVMLFPLIVTSIGRMPASRWPWFLVGATIVLLFPRLIVAGSAWLWLAAVVLMIWSVSPHPSSSRADSEV